MDFKNEVEVLRAMNLCVEDVLPYDKLRTLFPATLPVVEAALLSDALIVTFAKEEKLALLDNFRNGFVVHSLAEDPAAVKAIGIITARGQRRLKATAKAIEPS